MSHVVIAANDDIGTKEIAIRSFRSGRVKVHPLPSDRVNNASVLVLNGSVYSLGKGAAPNKLTVYASNYDYIRRIIGNNMGRRFFNASAIVRAEITHLDHHTIEVLIELGALVKTSQLERFIAESKWLEEFQGRYDSLVEHARQLTREGVLTQAQRRAIEPKIILSAENRAPQETVNPRRARRRVAAANVVDVITGVTDLIYVTPKLTTFAEDEE